MKESTPRLGNVNRRPAKDSPLLDAPVVDPSRFQQPDTSQNAVEPEPVVVDPEVAVPSFGEQDVLDIGPHKKPEAVIPQLDTPNTPPEVAAPSEDFTIPEPPTNPTPDPVSWFKRIADSARQTVQRWMNTASDALIPNAPEPTAQFKEDRKQVFAFMDLVTRSHLETPNDVARVVDAHRGLVIPLGNGRIARLGSILGRGGFGIACEAFDEAGNPLVIKLTKPHDRRSMFYTDGTNYSGEENGDAASARGPIVEVATLHSLNELKERNPGPQLFAAQFLKNPENPQEQILAIAMEKIEGLSLRGFLKESHENRSLVVVDLMQKLAEHLQTMHKAKLVHGDIKPANIIVQEQADGELSLRLIDFGSSVDVSRAEKQAKKLEEAFPENPATGMTRVSEEDKKLHGIPQHPSYAIAAAQPGSPDYHLPNEPLSHARDLYAFGRLMQYAIFGVVDFKNIDTMLQRAENLNDLDAKIFELSKKLTRTKPEKRPSIEYIINLLDGLKKDEEQITNVKNRIEKSSERPEDFSQAA